jgi:hypothetical protein
MGLLGIIIAALWLSALALCLELLFPKFFKRRRRRRPRRQSPQYSPSPLEARLVHLVSGDRATANRLISFARQQYPNRSHQWWLEKAIYDLERDRR